MKVCVWAHTSTQVGGVVGCHFSCNSLVCACGGCGGIVSHGAEGMKEKLIFQPFIVAFVPVTSAWTIARGFGGEGPCNTTLSCGKSISALIIFLQGGSAVIKIIKLEFNIVGHCTIALYQMRFLREIIYCEGGVYGV